jgi:hypothetical protein
MLRYRKTLLTLTITSFILLTSAGAARADVTLGRPEGWKCGELRVIQLDTVSGNQGFWLERDYRTAAGVSFKATLMGGKGPAMHNMPAPGLDAIDGPLGSGATYKTFTVGEYHALLERNPTNGPALTVKAGDMVLTLDGAHTDVSDEELIASARTLLSL